MARVLRVAVAGLEPGEIELDEAQARYVSRVHRLGAGDRFVAFDPERRLEAEATIVSCDKRAVRCRLSEPRPTSALPPARIVLLQAVGKGDRADRVVRDATALGVAEIVFIRSERSVVDLGDRARVRRRRWRTIAVEAARQSGRGDMPDVIGPLALTEAIERSRSDESHRFLLDPAASERLGDALVPLGTESAITLSVGPEGGWSEGEQGLLSGAGFIPVAVGRFILRTELAATAALGAVVARWKDDVGLSAEKS